MSIKVNINPIEIGDEKYYTIQQFCSLVNKSNQYIYNLVSKGNSIRRLYHLKVAGRILILAKEFTEFPFTCAGPGAKNKVYHYGQDGLPDWDELRTKD